MPKISTEIRKVSYGIKKAPYIAIGFYIGSCPYCKLIEPIYARFEVKRGQFTGYLLYI
jgi:hypothetical protein